jgi:hypothetical protein
VLGTSVLGFVQPPVTHIGHSSPQHSVPENRRHSPPPNKALQLPWHSAFQSILDTVWH